MKYTPVARFKPHPMSSFKCLLSLTLWIFVITAEVASTPGIDSINIKYFLSYSRTTSLVVIGDTLWAGTDGGGLVRSIGADNNTLQLTASDGLASNRVTRLLLADTVGAVWAGTDDGISHVSGNGIKTCKKAGNTQLGKVYSIAKSGEWIAAACEAGVAEYKNGGFELISSLSSSKAIYVFYSKDSSLWAAGENGLFRAKNGETSTIQVPMPLEKMIRERCLSGMVVDKDEYLWLSCYDDSSVVARYDGSEWAFFFNEEIGTDLSGDLLTLCPMGNVVAAGAYGISIFKNAKWEIIHKTRQPLFYQDICFPDTNQFIFTTGYEPLFYTTGNDIANIWLNRNRLENNDIRMMAVDRSNNLWLSCYASQWGIQKFDGTSWKNYYHRTSVEAGDGPIHNSVYSCAIDSIGGIWFGHDFGLSYFFNDKWTIFGAETGLPYIRVGSCLVAKDGKVWIGCQGGVMIYDGSQWTTFDTSDGLPGVISIDALAESNDGTIWAGTHKGIAWLENGRFHHDTGTGGPGNRGILAIETSLQNKIIVATLFHGAFVKINNQNWMQIIGDDTTCNDIEIDQQDRIWVSTTGSGIIVFDENLNRIRNIDVGLPYGFVDYLALNHNGSMWVATSFGLALITVYNSASIDKYKIKRVMNAQTSKFIGIYDMQGRKVSDRITLNRRSDGASGNYIYTDNNVVKKLLRINE